MRGKPGIGLGAGLAIGLLIVGTGRPALAGTEDGALSGATAAIARARAAAQKADQRAAKTDGESARAFEEAPKAPQPAQPPAEAKPAEAKPASPPTGNAAAPPPVGGGDANTAAAPAEDEDVPATLRSYDATAHRDPFAPPRLNAVADARTPLENYQLGQLKLVGVVAETSAGNYRAMVEDSAGLGYIITTGTPIGSSGGVVRSIEPTRVVIEESTRDFYGDVKPKEVVMELPQEDRSP